MYSVGNIVCVIWIVLSSEVCVHVHCILHTCTCTHVCSLSDRELWLQVLKIPCMSEVREPCWQTSHGLIYKCVFFCISHIFLFSLILCSKQDSYCACNIPTCIWPACCYLWPKGLQGTWNLVLLVYLIWCILHKLNVKTLIPLAVRSVTIIQMYFIICIHIAIYYPVHPLDTHWHV